MIVHAPVDGTFEGWKRVARGLLSQGLRPESVVWSPNEQTILFEEMSKPPARPVDIRVPRKFLDLARAAACFDDPQRWTQLYTLLFRLVYENRNLLSIESDPDTRRVMVMAKAVRRDIHKFHAFVRFRRVECDEREIYVAWHEPHHHSVEMATPFFARRFGSMNFSILTPKGCAHWNKRELTFSPGADRSLAPAPDDEEDFWLIYYRSIFNPFRLNVTTMKRELPVRHWSTLPEAVLIPELVRGAASDRV